jgi:hypothetical protein
MAKAKEQYDGTKGLVLTVREGQCACGCGADVAKGRKYRQGHDARLRGMLGRAFLAGVPVTLNGKRGTAAAQLKAHGFPEPPKPKAKAAKPKAKPKAKAKSKPKADRPPTIAEDEGDEGDE